MVAKLRSGEGSVVFLSHKPLPNYKYQKRKALPPMLRPEDDGKTFIDAKGNEYTYSIDDKVRTASWRTSVLLGADTETSHGKAFCISVEKSVATGWTANRKPSGFKYEGHVVYVNDFFECLFAFVNDGRGYEKKRSKKVANRYDGKLTVTKEWVDRNWMTDQYFYWNQKFDMQAIFKHLISYKYEGKLSPKHTLIMADIMSGEESYLDRILATGELIIPYGSYEQRVEIKKDCYKMETVYQWVEAVYLEGKWASFSFHNIWKIKKGKKYAIKPLEMWDIAQFFGKTRLDTAAKKELGYGKVETCFDGSKLDASRLDEENVMFEGKHFPYDPEDYEIESYRSYYKSDIEKYAIVDCELAGQLARKKAQEYIDAGVRFVRAYSPSNVAQTYLLDTWEHPQTVNLMETDTSFKELMRMGQEAYNGGNFDVQAIGFFPDCVQVDLVSAYIYIQYHLPALMSTDVTMKGKKKIYKEKIEGAIIKGDESNSELFLEWMEERKPYSVGFIEVKMEFPKGLNWYPILEEVKGCLTAPRIVHRTITADELVEALKWNPISVEYGEWVFHQEPSTPKYPFKKTLSALFKMKQDAEKGSAAYKVAKTTICSLYGKLKQDVDNEMGKLWNVAYAAVICGSTRARLAEINRLNGMKAISMATDGVIFRKSDLKVIPKRPLTAPDNLGEWEDDESGDVLIMGSGLYSFIGEEAEDYDNEWLQGVQAPRHFKTTYRGSAKLFLNASRHNDWKSFAEENCKESELKVVKSRPKSMKQARMSKDYSLINVFTPQEYKLKPFGDSTKRKCPIRPKTFGDLLDNQYKLVPYESAVEALAYKAIVEVMNDDK